MSERYIKPDWFTEHVFNPCVQGLTKIGISVAGSRVLRVRGRKSGEWRSNPVNLLTVDGQRYLVAPRGTTQWVRNLRVVGTGELRVGRRVEEFRGVEIADADKIPMLREYVRRWGWEVGKFFEGINKASSDEDLLKVAPSFPVFAVHSPATVR
jgi:deazaflavin-dependent oxidoreductase (nitroreductase family)